MAATKAPEDRFIQISLKLSRPLLTELRHAASVKGEPVNVVVRSGIRRELAAMRKQEQS